MSENNQHVHVDIHVSSMIAIPILIGVWVLVANLIYITLFDLGIVDVLLNLANS